jgi:hypothetical protein
VTQSTALAQRQQQQVQTKIKRGADGDGQDITILAVSEALERDGLERVESVVVVPADYQYAIPKWIHPNDLKEDDVVVKRSERMIAVGDKVGLTIDGYDYLNRVLGASFFLPEFVHDEDGNQKRNPIHRKDYIYERLACVWYTPVGQLVYATEDIEVDFRLAYMEMRASAKSAEPILDEMGQVQWDAIGNPLLKLSPQDEMKCLKEFTNKRNFGPRYAQSVARVRLLKQATGVRSLPTKVPGDYPLKMVTWRDQLTAQARIAQVTADTANLYGRPDETKPLTAAEMAEAGETGAVEETDLDREAVERAREAQSEVAETAAPEPTPTAQATPEPEPQQATLLDDTDDDLPPMR